MRARSASPLNHTLIGWPCTCALDLCPCSRTTTTATMATLRCTSSSAVVRANRCAQAPGCLLSSGPAQESTEPETLATPMLDAMQDLGQARGRVQAPGRDCAGSAAGEAQLHEKPEVALGQECFRWTVD